MINIKCILDIASLVSKAAITYLIPFQERSELMRKRAKIRLLQQRRQNEVSNFKDLPDNIPLQLTIGTRVTARYCQHFHTSNKSLFELNIQYYIL